MRTATPKTENDFIFSWPPRPTVAITPAQFEFFQRRGFSMTQFKLNGTCSVIGLGPDNRLELWNRHQEPLNWTMPPAQHIALRRLLAATDSPYWTIIVAELLHSKVKVGPRHTLFLHDVLTYAGESMVGYPYSARIGLLQERVALAPMPPERFQDEPDWHDAFSDQLPSRRGYFIVTPRIWVAANLAPSPAEAFQAIAPGNGIREGIVMKRPDAVLEPCIKESANSKSLGVKCRFGTKNYAH